ncbi:acetyl-CoA acetyltransferase, cytosolic isoform X2 [Acyrthosiphon pisum]|uniref:Acetyl-CoA acetyltransferase, cytosolic n=1 Tax=Acyrthosiphon pisum TaxID=7029 RepID=A0A8R1W7I5_ACYPI|nr:acetyl-CoA acetyltransferase, cytosolic isoform X1 [Acyrthosiphon pisum]XP_029342622.1 acetyl-CoA acetyltransferase, cytosolic isoform X2 [Acyrthosiphon pisum]|eukprot:XP_001951861.2 PREDICTED: acetyl-CoA acetyltransferase, cytosolic [Acyrthosiphon pisum]
MADEVYIVSAVRTPIGSFGGSLSSLKAHQLGSIVISEALKRANVNSNEVSEVILGQTLTAGQGQNPARQASINAGIPITVPAHGINLLCGSGLKSVVHGYQSIKCGDSSIVIAGGQESMSNAPHVVNIRSGVKMGNTELIDTMLYDGLTDAFNNIHMGITAENIAEQYNISRELQDNYAFESQKRTAEAQKNGYFKDEITPVEVKIRQNTIVFDTDEYPRNDTTLNSLSALRPAFKPNGGVVTVGNASGRNDGAAVVLLMNGEECKKRGCTPMAKIVAHAVCGLDPKIMGMGPVPAVFKTIEKAGWTMDSVDIFELNEAYAAHSIAVERDLGISSEKVNINGGAISLGHPIGASGARVLVTLVHILLRTGKKRGIASLCIGGGMGIAIAVETL